MIQFQDFKDTYGLPEQCETPNKDTILGYEESLPAELIDYWREFGWCSYGNGLLWFVNPTQFEGIIEDWVDFESGRPLVFMRTSFAHLYLWHNGYIYSLDPQYGSLSQVTKSFKRILTLLCDPEIQEKILLTKLHKEALLLLGPLDRDECYAFEPALALGGSGTVETVKRVKMREHLGLLAQIVRG